MLEFKVSDMMNDPGLSALDRQWIENFRNALEEMLVKKGGFFPDLSLFTVASSIGLDISGLHKEGTLLYALWITILNSLQKYITVNDFKYATVDCFLAAYPGLYQNEPEHEKRYLWLSANWMNILFRMITARKNKGLVLYVVPKLIEGWDAKYVTGSGQTKATAHRVHIFETEGNVKANQRGKMKNKKKPSTSYREEEDDSLSPRTVPAPKPKKRKTDPVLSYPTSISYPSISDSSSAFTFVPPYGAVTRLREPRYPTSATAAVSNSHNRWVNSEGNTDNEENNNPLNDDVKTTFAAWQEATENFGLGLLNLSRNNSYMNNGLAKNVDQQLTDPLDYQRGFSWTEIPVAPAALSTANSAASAMGYGQQQFPTATANVTSGSNPAVISSLFPQTDPAAMFNNTIAGPSDSPAQKQLNLEVGSIVPVSDLQDMFKGYK